MWSRGHSIENYLLDYPVISYAIQHYSDCPDCFAALELLATSYHDVLRLGCALGLAGIENGVLAAVRSTIRWQDIVLSPTVALNRDSWLEAVAQTHPKISGPNIYAAYAKWAERLKLCSNETVRWLCDGHIGVTVSLAAYQRAVFDVSENDASIAEKSLLAKKATCMLGGIVRWAEMAAQGQGVWPEDILDLISA